MLSQEENDLLTRVGPGTPAGQLLRRYWHVVAAASELTDEKPKKRVRILGENLLLYRNRRGGANKASSSAPTTPLYGTKNQICSTN